MLQVIKFGNDITRLTDYATHVHQLNHIWWHDEEGNRLDRDAGEMCMLEISELAEGLEGARKSLFDDKLPQYPMLWVELADTAIRALDFAGAYSISIEHTKDWVYIYDNPKTIGAKLQNLVDMVNFQAINFELGPYTDVGNAIYHLISGCVQIATEDGCSDFWEIVYLKLCYNQTRADHTYAARKAAGGKKF